MNNKWIRVLGISIGSIFVIGIWLFLSQVNLKASTKATTTIGKAVDPHQYPVEVNVPLDKTWQIDFDKEISKKALPYVVVKDSNGKLVGSIVTTANKKLYIGPPPNGYMPGEHYEIHIAGEFSFTDSKKIPSPIRLDFITIEDDVVDVTLSSKVREIPTATEDVNGNLVVPNSDRIAKGDIIIFQSKAEGKIALKATEVTQGNSGQIVTTVKPDLLELYDRMDVKTTVPITEDNYRIVPNEGIGVKSKVAYNLVNLYASTSKYVTTKGDYQFTDDALIHISGYIDQEKVENVMEFTFNDFKIESKNIGLKIDGTVEFTPELYAEIKKQDNALKLEKFNLVANTNTKSRLKYSFRGKLEKSHPFTRDFPLLEGEVTIPGAPYLQITYTTYLVLTVNMEGAPTIEVKTDYYTNSGVAMDDNGKFHPFFHTNNNSSDPKFSSQGSGSVKGGIGLSGGIQALGVVGAGLDLNGGLTLGGTGKLKGSKICGDVYFGPFFEANYYVRLAFFERQWPLPSKSHQLKSEPKPIPYCYDYSKDKLVSEDKKQLEDVFVLVPLGDSKNSSIKLPRDFAETVRIESKDSTHSFSDKDYPSDDPNSFIGSIQVIPYNEWKSYGVNERGMSQAFMRDGSNVFVFTLSGEVSIADSKKAEIHLKKLLNLEYYVLNSRFNPTQLVEIDVLPHTLDPNQKYGVDTLATEMQSTLIKYTQQLKSLDGQEEWNQNVEKLKSQFTNEAIFPTRQNPVPVELSENIFNAIDIVSELRPVSTESSFIMNRICVLRLEKMVQTIGQQITAYKNIRNQ